MQPHHLLQANAIAMQPLINAQPHAQANVIMQQPINVQPHAVQANITSALVRRAIETSDTIISNLEDDLEQNAAIINKYSTCDKWSRNVCFVSTASSACLATAAIALHISGAIFVANTGTVVGSSICLLSGIVSGGCHVYSNINIRKAHAERTKIEGMIPNMRGKIAEMRGHGRMQ